MKLENCAADEEVLWEQRASPLVVEMDLFKKRHPLAPVYARVFTLCGRLSVWRLWENVDAKQSHLPQFDKSQPVNQSDPPKWVVQKPAGDVMKGLDRPRRKYKISYVTWEHSLLEWQNEWINVYKFIFDDLMSVEQRILLEFVIFSFSETNFSPIPPPVRLLLRAALTLHRLPPQILSLWQRSIPALNYRRISVHFQVAVWSCPPPLIRLIRQEEWDIRAY